MRSDRESGPVASRRRRSRRRSPHRWSAAGWDARFDVLERWLADRLAVGRAADPAVARALSCLTATAGRVRIETLVAELGVSRRHLSRRIEAQPSRWADIAYAAGYADQAHLTREFRALAGVTPTEFVAQRMPEGGLVGHGLTAR